MLVSLEQLEIVKKEFIDLNHVCGRGDSDEEEMVATAGDPNYPMP